MGVNVRQKKKSKGGGRELSSQSLEKNLITEEVQAEEVQAEEVQAEETKTEDNMFSGSTEISYTQLLSENQKLRKLLKEKEKLILLQNASILRFKCSLDALLGNLELTNTIFNEETPSKEQDDLTVSLFEESNDEEIVAGLGGEVTGRASLGIEQVNRGRKKQSLLELLGYRSTSQIKEA